MDVTTQTLKLNSKLSVLLVIHVAHSEICAKLDSHYATILGSSGKPSNAKRYCLITGLSYVGSNT